MVTGKGFPVLSNSAKKAENITDHSPKQNKVAYTLLGSDVVSN
jgi:hypothetical protein